jgi:hypothetical protein
MIFLLSSWSLSLILEQRSRRIWLIDRQTGAIAEEVRLDLGGWLSRQLLSNIPAHRKACEEQVVACGLDPEELRREWTQQLTQQKAVGTCMIPIPSHNCC